MIINKKIVRNVLKNGLKGVIWQRCLKNSFKPKKLIKALVTDPKLLKRN